MTASIYKFCLSVRKITESADTETGAVFPNDTALLKALYLAAKKRSKLLRN